MKTQMHILVVLAALIGMLAFSGSGFAAPGGGGGNKPDDGGGSAPVDYGDLFILYRDANGVPYLTSDSCVQPLPSDTCTCELVAGEGGVSPPPVIPVNPDNCGVVSACSDCTQEVDFERINVARASDEVFDSQLADVVVNLATSDCVVSLDPAGRMVTSAGTIDSPLQSLAIHRQLMLTGDIGVPLPQDATILETAARALGTASGKTGEVNVDLVVYLNLVMGLSDPATTTILDPKICIDVREEVQGTVQLVKKCFLDYGDYDYNRGTNFGGDSVDNVGLPNPAYIPNTDSYGWFEYLAVLNSTPEFYIEQGPILDAVFCVDSSGDPVLPVDRFCNDSIGVGFLDGNIGGFAQASDDTRAVINFMHDWPMPDADVYGTPVPCEPLSDIAYEVLINDVSGFQVPKNYVNGGEREFTVTVINEGPDLATGSVTVIAGTEFDKQDLGFWTYDFIALGVTSESFVQLFTITTTSDTIYWKAVVDAEFDGVDDNNTRYATSTVKASGGGGGGH